MRNKWTNHVARTVQMIRKQKSDRTAKRKSQHGRYIPTKEHNDKMDIQQHRQSVVTKIRHPEIRRNLLISRVESGF